MYIPRSQKINKVIHMLSPVLLLLVVACNNGVKNFPTATDGPDLKIAEDSNVVAIQAVMFGRKNIVGQHYWRVTSDTNAVGGKVLQATPNTGKVFPPGAGPRVDYRVTFNAPGTYYVWVRSSGLGGSVDSSNSLHVGLNGKSQYGATDISGGTYQLGWINKTASGKRAVLKVPSSGTHTLNVWMREDGFKVDSLVLASNSTYSPVMSPPEAPTLGEDAPDALASKLTWSPPTPTNPRTVSIAPDSTQSIFKLDSSVDYIIDMPGQPVTRGLIFVGGRNVVLVGGEIAIPWQGKGASIASRTALKIKSATGTVHIEGLLMRGQDLSEGIQLDAPNAVVQLQNIGIFDMHARDQANFTDNHPDLIQSYGNVRRLRVDRFTGTTDFQGFFFAATFNGAHGPINLKRVNIIGKPTARQLLWLQPQVGAGAITLDRVYLDISATRKRNIGEAVYPSIWSSKPNTAILSGNSVGWPSQMQPLVSGYATSGRPAEGSYVSPNIIGISYVSPGYF